MNTKQIESARRRYIAALGTPDESRILWELRMLVEAARGKR